MHNFDSVREQILSMNTLPNASKANYIVQVEKHKQITNNIDKPTTIFVNNQK